MQFSEIDDCVLLTQEAFVKKGAFTDLQSDLSDHVAVRELWKGKQKKFEGGHPWKFEAQVDHNWSARAVGLYETDGSSQTDTFIEGEVPVRHMNAHYIYELREPAFQRGGKAIVDYVRSKYIGMMISFYETLEAILWGKPTDSADTRTPLGLQYWITRNNTEGFNGGRPTGFTDKGNIDPNAQARWKNWTNSYAAISKEDLIRKMRRAHRRIQFRSPVSHANPTVGPSSNGIYTNDDVVGLMEELLEAQNMNLGNDLASKDGRVMFKGTPVTYAPYLNDDAYDPIYLIDWKWIAIGILSGWENQLTKPYMVPNKHNVRRVDLDCSLNMIATDLRRLAIIHKAV